MSTQLDVAANVADVCLILEGTYPYVPGGVSSWVHTMLRAFSARRFSLFHIGPQPGAYGDRRFEVPSNVIELKEVFCVDNNELPQAPRRPRWLRRRAKSSSRTLSALHRLHTEAAIDSSIVDDLAVCDLSVAEFLHGDAAFNMICDLYQEHAAEVPFVEFFWQCRSLHLPLLRLLSSAAPKAGCYHAVSTGYAGLVGAVASVRTGRPLLLTEHGLYARERDMELQRASWISDMRATDRVALAEAQSSPLRVFWSHFFYRLSQLTYHRAQRIITLSEVNRQKQLSDGADNAKCDIIPNGVEPHSWAVPDTVRTAESSEALRVGFVGRVVPIKDVLTLIKACHIALQRVALDVSIIGPQDEDADYARRCHALVKSLGRCDQIRFLGPQPTREYYPKIDVLLLTSLSEGQPLVILEGQAAGLPVIATDVGACRELLEGRDAEDATLGASGLITKVANPMATADALVRLAKDRRLRKAMSKNGLARVCKYYQLDDVVNSYANLYKELV